MTDEPIVDKYGGKGHIRLKLRDGIVFSRIKDAKGLNRDYYTPGQILPEWADHDIDQAAHLIAKGILEPCDDRGVPTDPGRVIYCVSALICVGVEPGQGRPRASELLRANNLHFSNDTLSKALRCFNDENWKAGDPIPAPKPTWQ